MELSNTSLSMPLCNVTFAPWESSLHWALTFASLPSLLLNLAVLRTAWRLASREEEPTHFLVASMALADALLCANTPLQRLYEMALVGGRTVFLTVYGTVWVGVSASALSLSLLNLDRLVFFHWSLRYRRLFEARKTLALVGLLWLLCVVWTGLGLGLLREPEGEAGEEEGWTADTEPSSASCHNPWTDDPRQDPNWYAVHGLVFGLWPVLSSCVVSAWLLLLNRRRKRESSTATASLLSAGQTHRPSGGRDKSQWKIIRFVIATTVWTAVSFLPLRLYVYLKSYGVFAYSQPAFFGLACLTYLNPVVNPIVTLTFHRKYHRHFVGLFRGRRSSGYGESTTGSHFRSPASTVGSVGRANGHGTARRSHSAANPPTAMAVELRQDPGHAGPSTVPRQQIVMRKQTSLQTTPLS